MGRQQLGWTWILGAIAWIGLSAPVAGDDAKQAREDLDKYLAKTPGTDRGQVAALTDEPAIKKEFPKFEYFVLRFRQFPVAIAPPEPFQSNNVLAVNAKGEVEALSDKAALEKFFKANAAPVKQQPSNLMRSWLRLSQELHQDGFYQFEIDKEFRGAAANTGAGSITGTNTVKPTGGTKGQITATIDFDEKGKITKITEEAKLLPGPRPRCQSTRLLDPDPLVRYMAEQNLLIMGRACKEYLSEQRAKAGPELRQAIDRIWQRIVEEDR